MTCNCHACTCAGCFHCDPPEPAYRAEELVAPTPPELLTDPWADAAIGGTA